MRVEPAPSRWLFPAPGEGQGDLVALGGDLEPGTLLTAYRSGLFPMPDETGQIAWFSPDPRAILELDHLSVSRSLRRSMRRFTVTRDKCFDEVVAACADPGRPGSWITREFAAAYGRLHSMGWAHSIETWDDAGRLAGGLYGVSIGGLFAGESMFHRARDASKVALVHLVDLLRNSVAALLDVQWLTGHMASLGATQIRRSRYLERLVVAVANPSDVFALQTSDSGDPP
jgi:leucyl/phenylalanyl-tRNA---protein transferase